MAAPKEPSFAENSASGGGQISSSRFVANSLALAVFAAMGSQWPSWGAGCTPAVGHAAMNPSRGAALAVAGTVIGRSPSPCGESPPILWVWHVLASGRRARQLQEARRERGHRAVNHGRDSPSISYRFKWLNIVF
jgi:hypothetical protein